MNQHNLPFILNPHNDINERKTELSSYLPYRHGLILAMQNTEETEQDFLMFAMMNFIFGKFVFTLEEAIEIINAQKQHFGFVSFFVTYLKQKTNMEEKEFLIKHTNLEQDLQELLIQTNA